jgi:hypothetical protein
LVSYTLLVVLNTNLKKEYFADYCAINPDFYSLNLTYPQNPLYGNSPTSWDGRTLSRVIEGLLSVLLSLKKKPLIRYEKMSVMAKKLAQEINVSNCGSRLPNNNVLLMNI